MNGTLYNSTGELKELEYTGLSDSECEEILNADDYHWSNLYSITKKEHKIPRQCVYFLEDILILEDSSLRICAHELIFFSMEFSQLSIIYYGQLK